MEVKETAACGISLREFAIEIEEDEIVDIYRIMNFAQNEEGFYDEDFLDDLKGQMSYITSMEMVIDFFDVPSRNPADAAGDYAKGPAHYTHEQTQRWWRPQRNRRRRSPGRWSRWCPAAGPAGRSG